MKSRAPVSARELQSSRSATTFLSLSLSLSLLRPNRNSDMILRDSKNNVSPHERRRDARRGFNLAYESVWHRASRVIYGQRTCPEEQVWTWWSRYSIRRKLEEQNGVSVKPCRLQAVSRRRFHTRRVLSALSSSICRRDSSYSICLLFLLPASSIPVYRGVFPVNAITMISRHKQLSPGRSIAYPHSCFSNLFYI